MSLAPGTRLGAYEVLALIGAGGMGEVYRAHDARLGRDVAIKVLPAAFSADPERLPRFAQEARAAAALNHPNILAIYDIGHERLQSSPASHDEDITYVVSELLEGATLRETLTSGALPVKRVVDYGVQIASGLAAAHEKGIVHRDLKPENLFITRDKRIKILDFGLAKLTEPVPESVGASLVATRTVDTTPGMVLGTIGYMSPEQVRGQMVDHRADIFSFGAVLYEMLSGKRAFKGETSADTLSAILNAEPPELSETNRAIPPALENFVRHCLEKRPDDRFQSVRDMAFHLDALSNLSSRTDEAMAGPKRRAPVFVTSIVVITGIAAVIALASGAYLLTHRRTTESAGLDAPQVVQLTTSGNAERPTISPDGKYVAYVQHSGTEFSLWIRQTTTGSNVQIIPPDRGVELLGATVTPDGSFVDYVRRQAPQAPQVWRVPFLGGQPKPLIDNIWSPVGWSLDGRHLAFVRADSARGSSAVIIADPDGAHERVLAAWRRPALVISLSSYSQTGQPSIRPAWSPDGRLVAVAIQDQINGVSTVAIAFVDVATGSVRPVPLPPPRVFGLAWLGDDALLLNQTVAPGFLGQLWRVSYPDGRLSRVTNDPNDYHGVSVTGDGGRVVTARSETRTGIWIGDGSAENSNEAVPSEAHIASVAWAGERLLYDVRAGGRVAIMSVAPGVGTPQELIANGRTPAATPDGRTIVYYSLERVERSGLLRVDGEGRHAVSLAQDAGSGILTPDGRSVIFGSARSGLQSLWIMPLEGGSPTQLVKRFASSPAVSPDGRSLLFDSRGDQGLAIVMLCDLPECAAPRNLDVPAGRSRQWMPDGRALAYVDMAGTNIWVQRLAGGPPRQLTHFTDRTIEDFAWSHDGKRLAIARSTATNDIVLFKGLKR
jgi:serine/threonine protein kinase